MELISRDQFFENKANREMLAIALILYKDFRVYFGNVDWGDAALESTQVAKILGVSSEFSQMLSQLPPLEIREKK